jgi:acetoin:2,6-dichlorophenolindophenol oxidoreductase subunit alpha
MKKYSKEFLIGLYYTMLKIRTVEESLVEPILEGKIKTPCHLYSGEEAIATGICAALSKDDYVFGNHRSHGHYIAKGGDLNKMIAEIYCKETGCAKGRGGSMHLVFPEVGFLGAVPIVAGTISLATGTALASKIRGESRVTVSFFGDGASCEGVLSECLNFAALKRLPIVFVCENNFYSTHMPIREIRPNPYIYKIALPFGIKSYRIDGNDVLKVYETAKKAVALCREGKGPVFIECVTYRLRGHVGPDDNIQGVHTDIRPKKEIEKWIKKDPIKRFEKFLVKNKVISIKEIEEIRKNIMEEVKEAHIFATNHSPYPKKEEVTKYVFKE